MLATNDRRFPSLAVFGAFLVITAATLFWLYQWPTFGEKADRRVMVLVIVAMAVTIWAGRANAIALLDRIASPIRRYGWRAVAVASLASLAIGLAVARNVLDGFANSADEFAYVVQAETYAEGRLWASPPPLPEAFRQLRLFEIGDKWVSQYPPGWAILLAPAAALGLPLWIIGPLIGAATIAAFFHLARRSTSEDSAWLGALLLMLSAFFIFQSASYFAHSLAALLAILFALAGMRFLERGEASAAALAGACIGFIGLTRAQSAALTALPFVMALVARPSRRLGFIWFALGGAPFALALLSYNAAITGDPFVSVQSLPRNEPLGPPSLAALSLMLTHCGRLVLWTAPPLVLGYVAAFVVVARRRTLAFTDWIMPTTLAFYLLYAGDGGNQYGPRYLFEAWPFALITVLKAIDPILFQERGGSRRAWIASAMVASLVFQIAYFFPRALREHKVVVERQDVYRQAENAARGNAVVLIATDVGKIRPMSRFDLVRNGLAVEENRIIYAVDLGERNAALRTRFPDRAFYVYVDGRLVAAPSDARR